MGFVFPRQWERFQRYLSFRDVAADEVKQWQAALAWFLKKLTSIDGRPLLLKSPPHTARIRQLLELFPDARFVHIYRDPYTVFRSTRQLFERVTAMFSFQRFWPEQLPERALQHYRAMYDAFFEDVPLIPPGNFCDVRFADLERDPLGQMERVYQSLNLPNFNEVRPALENYLATLKDYRKNEYPPLAEEMRRRVAKEWQRSIEEWGYPA
jgi:hypothetical protein